MITNLHVNSYFKRLLKWKQISIEKVKFHIYLNLYYKEDQDFFTSTRIQDNLLPEEKEIILPSVSIEEIYQRLITEIENPEENYYDLMKNIIFAQYYLNDPNIGRNVCYQSFLRKMGNIIINSQNQFSMTMRTDAIYLIDKFMEHKKDDSIHFIRSLDMADGFLTLFEETSDEKLNNYLLHFFLLLAGHCRECQEHIIGYFINHPNAFEKIMRYIRSIDPIDQELKKWSLLFLKNLSKYEMIKKRDSAFYQIKCNITIFCAKSFLHILLTSQDFPPSQDFVESIFGLCLIIQNKPNSIWRPVLQGPLTENISQWLKSFDYPDVICAFLILIYHWYLKNETFDSFDVGLIINFLIYQNTSYPDHIQSVRYFATRTIYAIALRGKQFISNLIEKNILDIALQLFSESNFKIKKSIASFSSIIAKRANESDKRNMAKLGYLNIFLESIDPVDDELTYDMLSAIMSLFQASQNQEYNCCVEIIQQIPEFGSISDIANNGDPNSKSVDLARLFLSQYFINEEQ